MPWEADGVENWQAAIAFLVGLLLRPLLAAVSRYLRGSDLPTVEQLGEVATGKAPLPCPCVEARMPNINCCHPGHTPLGRRLEGKLLSRRGRYVVLQVQHETTLGSGRYFIACQCITTNRWSAWYGAAPARATFDQARDDIALFTGEGGKTLEWN